MKEDDIASDWAGSAVGVLEWVQSGETAPESEAAAPTGAENSQTRGGNSRPKAKNRQKFQGIIALVGATLLLIIAVARLLPSTATNEQAQSQSATSSPPLPKLSAVVSRSVVAIQVLGTSVSLNAPQEAAELPNGHVAVVDTGNRRLILLDTRGHLLREVTAGAAALQQPYAVAVSSRAIFLLDGQRQAIERYDLSGHFQGEIILGAELSDAKGMALGPDGDLYVANPRSNSIVVVTQSGKIVRQIGSPIGSGRDELNQPSDVAVGSDGILYVLDNGNMRIKAMTSEGIAIHQWPAPPSTTPYSVHVLPLSDGRLLASDPAGFLLIYPREKGPVMRVPLHVSGIRGTRVEPLGVASAHGVRVLVTDNAGNRVLVVSLPTYH